MNNPLDLRHLPTRLGTLDTVLFSGSSSSQAAIRVWLSGAPYVAPAVSTRDWHPMDIDTPDGVVVVQPGSYVVVTPDGPLVLSEAELAGLLLDGAGTSGPVEHESGDGPAASVATLIDYLSQFDPASPVVMEPEDTKGLDSAVVLAAFFAALG